MECFRCGEAAAEECRQCGRPFCAEHGRERCVECAAPERVLPLPWLLPGTLALTSALVLVAVWFVSPWTPLTDKEAGAAGGLAAFPASPPALVEPTSTPVPGPTPEPTPVLRPYTVQPGDTLFELALSFGVTVEEILAVNDIADPSQLQVGQVIHIPRPSQ